MLEELKEKVLKANLLLPELDLVKFTWGNVSEIDREKGIIAIKPSGVDYENLTADDIVLVDLDGNIVEGKLRPSSDTATHIELYKTFSDIGGVVHTHSEWAVSWAQSRRGIPCYGTTHADCFYGEIPCTREMTDEEIESAYEKNTGIVIAETFMKRNIDPMAVPGVLCVNHGPFSWGKNGHDAVHNAAVLETVAEMATKTELLNPSVKPVKQAILDKHYFRKHGKNAYYGQN